MQALQWKTPTRLPTIDGVGHLRGTETNDLTRNFDVSSNVGSGVRAKR